MSNVDQPSTADIPLFFDVPEQLWIVYESQDQKIRKKVPRLGIGAQIALIRPRLSEEKKRMYLFSLQTDSDSKAQQFIDRFMKGTIGELSLLVSSQDLILSGSVPSVLNNNQNGIIDDTKVGGSGIKGSVLLTDLFLPLGIGAAPLYYSMDPSILLIDQLLQMIISYIDDRQDRTVIATELQTKIPLWIVDYAAGKKNDFEAYMLEKASWRLVKNPSARSKLREWNDAGKKMLNTILNGQVSLKNYPLSRSGATNHFTQFPYDFEKVEIVTL